MSYNSIVVALSSLKPFFFNGLKKELCFSDNTLEHKTPESNKSVDQIPCCLSRNTP